MTIKCCCLNFFSIVSYTRERQQNINMDWLNWSRNSKTKSWLFHHAAVQQFRISNITAALKDPSLCHALSNETFMFPFPVLPVYFCNLPRAVASIGQGGQGGQLPPQTKIGIFVFFVLLICFPGIKISDYWPLQLSIFERWCQLKTFYLGDKFNHLITPQFLSFTVPPPPGQKFLATALLPLCFLSLFILNLPAASIQTFYLILMVILSWYDQSQELG